MITEALHRLCEFILHTIWIAVFGALLTVAGALGWMHLRGIPESWQTTIRAKLEERGIVLTYKKLFLDPTGHLVVTQGHWLNPKNPSEVLLQFNRLRIGVAWLSWLRDRPFLKSISVVDADVDYPVGEETIKLRGVRADFRIAPDELRIESLSVDALKLRLTVTGIVPTDGLRPSALFAKRSRPQGTNLLAIANAWRSARQVFDQIQSDQPIEIAVRLLESHDPDSPVPDLAIDVRAAQFRYNDVSVRGLEGEAILTREGLKLKSLELETGGGKFRAWGTADLAEGRGEVTFDSTANLLALARATGKLPADPVLAAIRFDRPPSTQGRVAMSWTNGFHSRLLADVDWRGIRCRGSTIDRLWLPLAFEPGRFFVPEGSLTIGTNTLGLRFVQDSSENLLSAVAQGSLDPTLLKGFLPEGVQPFLASCEFRSVPFIQGEFSGSSMRKGDWDAKGHLLIKDAVYKGIDIVRLETDFASDGSKLEFRNLHLDKREGRGFAPELTYGLTDRIVTLRKAAMRLHVQQTAHLFGGKFETYCAPYVFQKGPPDVLVDGRVDLGGGPATDIEISAKGGPMTYPFLGVLLPLDTINTGFRIKGDRLHIHRFRGDMHGGLLSGTARFHFIKPLARFETHIDVANMDFRRVMENLFKVRESTGILNGHCDIGGTVSQLRTLQGSGNLRIHEGNLRPIPFLGALSQVLSAVIPRLGYETATDAEATFDVAEGYVNTKDLEIRGSVFTIICDGRHDFVGNNLGLDARVNMRGPVGVALYPVSKLFEYHGTGPMKSSVWRPKILQE